MRTAILNKHCFAWILFATLLPIPGKAADSFQVGVGVHVGQNRNNLAKTSAALASAGATFRDEVLWSRVELQKGVLAYPAVLSDLEKLVNDAVAHHQKPILILDYGNKFYENGALPKTPEAIEAYSRYAAFVVKYFAGRVTQFEVWNEWNSGTGVHPMVKQTPESYVALLQAAYKAIKAANPDAKVLGGVLSSVDLNWVDAFGRAGGFSYLDAFSIHPYEFWYTTAPAAPGSLRVISLHTAAAGSFTPIRGTPESDIAKLDALKQHIDAAAPGRNLRVYVSEVSWPTNTGQFGMSEAAAAAYLQRFMALARVRPWIAGVWWYDLFDDGTDASNKENRFGLLHEDGSSKPAFDALVALKDVLHAPGDFSANVSAEGVVVVSGKGSDGKAVEVTWLATNDLRQGAPAAAAGSLSANAKALTSGAPSGAISGYPSLTVGASSTR
jgi:hypothetical protein